MAATRSFGEHTARHDGGAEPAAAVFELPTSFERIRLQGPACLDSWRGALVDSQAEAIADLHRADPQAAERVVKAMTTMPQVGGEFLGFRLLGELGRGAFARVYLAEQPTLANRHVVLKVTPDIEGELRTLAQLQHTNVMPIYSVHRATPLQAVCMPYFGSTTLAAVLKNLLGRESLPASGKGLISTLVDRQNTTRRAGGGLYPPSDAIPAPQSLANPASEPPPEPEAVAKVTPNAVLQMLQGFSYVDAVLWMGARLADGLAHAHEQGILHRDLKPANILLTDYGQPMLLDFNLAQDTKVNCSPSAALIGGTLPFMAPEQLVAYRAATCTLNPNSDVYSLGVILYELLAGRHPFTNPSGEPDEALDQMILDRLQPAPEVRRWNKAVSPAVESIIRHCLEPDPQQRYQSAAELKEDLERQLAHQPLKYAPEPSRGERVRKWMRRHPRLASTTSVAALGIVVVILLATSLVYRSYRLDRLEAADGFQRFEDEVRAGQLLLTVRGSDQEQLSRGIELGRKALERYGVLDNAAWLSSPEVQALPAADQERLREIVGAHLLLLARATTVKAAGAAGAAGPEDLRTGLEMNRLAEACFAEDKACRATFLQRAELARLLGLNEEARRYSSRAEATALRTAWDHYLVGREHVVQGRYQEAIPFLETATQQDPQSFWAWFVLGLCRDHLSQDAEAITCYSASILLWPDSPWAHFNRGLVHLRQKAFQRARVDFDQAIRLKPDFADAFVNRALAKQGLQKHAEALQDLTSALEQGFELTRVYFMRARVREKLGDAEGAKRDREEGMRCEPKEEKSWIARGLARLPADLQAALADFDKAIELNPRSLAGLQNKAHVLSRQNHNAEAVKALDKVIALYPDYVPARAGRGVLLARLKQKDAAHKDAQEALLRDGQPATAYQVAGIYALTSQENPDDVKEAYRLLSSSLRRGYGFELLEKDRDLDPIRAQPEFRRLVEAARALQATSASPPKPRTE